MSQLKTDRIIRWEDGRSREDCDDLAQEEPLEIRIRGHSVSVTMRTPDHDDELAVGLLLSEGIIRKSGDVLSVQHCDRNDENNVINVQLSPEVPVDLERFTRHIFASSSCGLCGKASIDAIRTRFTAVKDEDGPKVPAELIASLPEEMRKTQAVFDRTGGLHAAAVFDGSGKMLVLREDIGRHNAVDKVLGWSLMKGPWPLSDHILLVSGRASFEIMQKSLAGAIPIVASVSAPSSLAVKFAAESGQTLIGFLRQQRMNIYSGFQRIQ